MHPKTSEIVMKTCPKCHQALTYTVKPGDTLAKIAAFLYPNGQWSWQSLFHLNRFQIKNPNLIYVGQQLRLPA